SISYFPTRSRFSTRGPPATSVTLSIANKQLTITAPGDPNAQVTWDLSSSGSDLEPSGLDTVGGLIFSLNQRVVFAVTAMPNLRIAVKSEDLADIVAQDIKR